MTSQDKRNQPSPYLHNCYYNNYQDPLSPFGKHPLSSYKALVSPGSWEISIITGCPGQLINFFSQMD